MIKYYLHIIHLVTQCLILHGHAESDSNECYCQIRHGAFQAACAAGGRAFIVEQRLRLIGGWADEPAVHTEVLAGRGDTCK